MFIHVFFFVFKLFLNVFLHFSRKFFFSSGTFFFPVHEVGSSWQDGSCATQLPPARRCASRIKRQKLWRYCAAKREALSSGVLGEAPSKIGVVSQLPSCHANPSKNFSFKKRKNCKNILPKCFRLCLLCFRIITEF